MAHVVNFSPLPSDAVAAQVAEVEVDVVSVRDVADELEACRGATVAIADFSNERRITAEHLAVLAPTCRAVVVPSAGLDAIDMDAARANGVVVASARGLNADAVAEWAIWAAVGALRHLAERDLRIREGEWQQFGTRFELAHKQVGLLGLGPIGEGIARRLAGWDVDLAYWTRTRRPQAREGELGLRHLDLDDLVASSDVLFLCVALAPGTQRLLDAERLATMKSTAVVVNAGRGGLVDDEAVVAALAEGRLHGYATDVFTVEPAPADDPLLAAATIATPHVAGVTGESVGRILGSTLEQVRRALAGEPLERVVD